MGWRFAFGGVALAAVATLAVGAPPAAANPLEVLGLTSRHAGQANAGVASADDAAALYYDPAGLVIAPGMELAIGTIGASSHLAVGDRRSTLTHPIGVQLAMRAPLPLGGAWRDRIVVGLALHLLPHDVLRVEAPAPEEPAYTYYGDRMSRVVVLPGIAVRVTDRLALGVAVDVLAGLTGSIEASEGATRALDARIDERVPTIARVLAGTTLHLTPALRLGVVYRQRFEVPFATTAKTMVAGEPIDLDVRAAGQFTPHEVEVGVAYTACPGTASLDAGWHRWSGWAGPFVRVSSALPLVGEVPGQPPRVPFDDTFVVRLGAESSPRAGWTARAGYALETSAVPATQTGVTNLLDGTHHTLALGAGHAWGRLRVDAHVQLQLVAHRTLAKSFHQTGSLYDPFVSLRDEDAATPGDQSSNPGYPSLTSGGQVLAGGVTLEVGL